MIRIVVLAEEDVVTDPAGVGESLTALCRKAPRLSLSGVCPVNGRVLFILEESLPGSEVAGGDVRIVLAPLPDPDLREIVAEIRQRHEANYSTRGVFTIGNTRWGVFVKGPFLP